MPALIDLRLPPPAASILTSVLALNALSLVMCVGMYATRLPAMAAAKIKPQDAAHPRTALDKLPSSARRVADNYNHLLEAPTVFYAAAFAVVLLDKADATAANLAWIYVLLRGAHSAVQATVNIVTIRFVLFALSWAALGLLIVRGLMPKQ